jgi:pilus assembly protein Flp/PilA
VESIDMQKLVSFLTNCSGATSIEYAIIAVGVAVAVVATVNSLGSTVKSSYTSVSNGLP